jgi:sugar phosphate permease
MSDVNPATGTGTGTADRRRWVILGVIGLAQLMVVLDVTVMNIALPSAQRALHFSTVDRQWVVTAYTLAFGSLLLFGGRLADLLGRKVTFMIGLAGFAGVSAIGGASVNFAMLATARAFQGAFGAILVPSALSLLTTTFTDPKDRGKAFGVYGAIAALDAVHQPGLRRSGLHRRRDAARAAPVPGQAEAGHHRRRGRLRRRVLPGLRVLQRGRA